VILPDVNVLIYAHRRDAREHRAYRDWLEGVLNGDVTYAVSDVVLSGFVRVATHPRIMAPPSTTDQALTFTERLLDQPHCVMVRPGPRHWDIFGRLCREIDARGNLVPDAFLAALAIEAGCEIITADRDFARFKGLRWRHPLA
jgi:toxin-antitoxin system PIN domain toxin